MCREAWSRRPTITTPPAYLAPSYAFGNLVLAAHAKVVMGNNYPDSFSVYGINPMYFGGGWLAGAGPAWKQPLDEMSSLDFFGEYDFIVQENANVDAAGTGLANASFNYWTLGTDYQINF